MSGFGGFGGFGSQNNQNQGNTGFGGFGANNNANNNNNTTGGFGTSTNTGFGATNNTSGGSLFGGNNANTGFGSSSGGFGTTNQTSTGFGANRAGGFGSSTSGGLFGQANNNTNTNATTPGFGGFGNNQTNTSSGFGSGGSSTLFGSNANANNTSNTTTTGFGASTGGSLFGNTNNTTNTGFGNTAQASTGFGATNTGFGGGAAPQNNGTGGTPFQQHTEKDANSTSNFQSIVCQAPYQNFQFEELRVADYNQGRKYGNQSGQPGAFGASTGFGGFGNNNNAASSTGFSATSTTGGAFGQQNNTSPFGQSANTATGGFGANTSGGLFGQAKPAGSSLFGSSAANNQTSGGLFGNTGSGFGATNQTTGFGNNNSTSTGGGMFGQQNTQNKPLFGQANNTATGFGQGTSPGFGQTPGGGNSLFGNNQTQASGFGTNQQSAQPNSLFGGGGFGQTATQNQPQQQGGNSLFGGFGQAQQQKPSLFGTSGNTSNLFGQNQQQPGGGLFGNNQSQANQQQGNSLFAPKPAGTGPFGQANAQNTTAGGNLFGSLNNNTANQQQGSSLFGQNQQQKPLFGSALGSNNTNTGGSLFGGMNQNNQQQQGGSLFSSTIQNQQGQQNQSLFGNNLQNQPQQQQPNHLTTSISSTNPYGNDLLFQALGTPQQSVGPLATPLSSSQKARKPAPLPQYRINPSASSRLITPQKRSGYGFSYSSYGTPGSVMSSSTNSPVWSSRSLGKSLSTSNLRTNYNVQDSILRPNAFSPGSMRSLNGSGSMRKLKIDKSLRTDLFGVEAASEPRNRKSVSFDPESRKDLASGLDSANSGDSGTISVRIEGTESPTPSAEELGYLRPSRDVASAPNGSPLTPEVEKAKGNELAVVPEDESPPVSQYKTSLENARVAQKQIDVPPGEYYTEPSMQELKKMSRKDLSSVKGFVVGRQNTGKIEFSDVDLTNVPLDKICGDIVKLETRSATVYADHADKPQPGKGLNVPSTVTLGNSWPRARGGTQPVYDKQGPKFDKHLLRLKRVQGTQFVEYRVNTGEWVFRVDHFSTYALDYSEDEGEMDSTMLSAPPDSPTPQSTTASRRHNAVVPSAYHASRRSEQSEAFELQAEDTFEFRKSQMLPGAFDEHILTGDMYPEHLEQNPHHYSPNSSQYQRASTQASDVDPRFSTNSSLPTYDSTMSEDAYGSPEFARNSSPPPKSILKHSSNRIAIPNTPERDHTFLDDDWLDQLQRTMSPKKQDRQALRQSQGAILKQGKQDFLTGSTREKQDDNPFATSVDIMNSLFGYSMGKKGAPNSHKQSAGDRGFKNSAAKRPKPTNGQPIVSNTLVTGTQDDDDKFHNSFKPSWSSQNTLVYAIPSDQTATSKRMAASPAQKPLKGAIRDIMFMQPYLSSSRGTEGCLKKQKELSVIDMEDGVPRARLGDDVIFAQFAASIDDVDAGSQHERYIWQLASILFDPVVSKEGRQPDDAARKQVLSEFWKTMVTSSVLEQVRTSSSAEEKAVVFLSGFNVWNATDVLLKGGDYKLATMVAQIGGDENVKKAMQDQLAFWREKGIISEMAFSIRTLYELLAGNTCTATGVSGVASEDKAESFNISSQFGLDWSRSFALRLWYGTTVGENISEAVQKYADDLATSSEKIFPRPWFAQIDDDRPQDNQREDTLWGLLKLYAILGTSPDAQTADLASILSPANVSPNPFDARPSFQLYHVLLNSHKMADLKHLQAPEKADLLASSLSFQLESQSLVDATFVLLHLSTAAARETAVKGLLERQADRFGTTTEGDAIFKSLVEDLHIPESWIWEARALHAKAVFQDDTTQITCLLKAGHFSEAQNRLHAVVAPRLIIEEDIEGLQSMLSMFNETSGTKRGPALTTSSEVLNDFVTLDALVKRSRAAGWTDAKTNKDVEQLLKKLSSNIPTMNRSSGSTLEAHVAATAMSTFAREVINEIEARERKKSGDKYVIKGLDRHFLRDPKTSGNEILQNAINLSQAYYTEVSN